MQEEVKESINKAANTTVIFTAKISLLSCFGLFFLKVTGQFYVPWYIVIAPMFLVAIPFWFFLAVVLITEIRYFLEEDFE